MLSTNAYHKLSKYSCVIVKLIQKQVKNCKTYLTYVTSYISFRNRKRVRHIINHTKVSRHSPEFGDLNSCCLLKCLITEAKKLLLANLFYVPYGEVAISPGLVCRSTIRSPIHDQLLVHFQKVCCLHLSGFHKEMLAQMSLKVSLSCIHFLR